MESNDSGSPGAAIATVVVLALTAVALVLVALVDGTAALARSLEKVSALIAVIDDLLVRLLGVTLLVIAAVGLAVSEYRALYGKKAPSRSPRYFTLLKYGALLGFSGTAFFAAYPLDEMDDELIEDVTPVIAIPPSAQVLARWVQVVAAKDSACRFAAGTDTTSGTATALDACPYDFLVRAVVARDAACPEVEVKVTYAGGREKSQPLDGRKLEQPSGFDEITVCQARLERDGGRDPQSVTFPDAKAIQVASRWPEGAGPQNIVAFGDTGCRANNKQPCTKKAEKVKKERKWRLAQIARHLGRDSGRDHAAPDLVIHLGDFMYVKFDAWDTWKASFFDPAAPLLTAAPWIMVRGNHERCGKFGQAPLGFYLFFDIGDAGNCEDDAELTDTYAVDLSETHRVIVADSTISFAQDVRGLRGKKKESIIVADKDQAPFGEVKQVLDEVKHLAQGKDGKTVWLATHVPVFALEECKKKDEDSGKCNNPAGGMFAADSPGSSAMMRAAWEKAEVTGVTTILAGDLHLLQVVKADGARPRQITVGTGGVNLDPVPLKDYETKDCQPGAALKEIEDGTAPDFATGWHMCSTRTHGYLIATKNNDGTFDMTFKALSE